MEAASQSMRSNATGPQQRIIVQHGPLYGSGVVVCRPKAKLSVPVLRERGKVGFSQEERRDQSARYGRDCPQDSGRGTAFSVGPHLSLGPEACPTGKGIAMPIVSKHPGPRWAGVQAL